MQCLKDAWQICSAAKYLAESIAARLLVKTCRVKEPFSQSKRTNFTPLKCFFYQNFLIFSSHLLMEYNILIAIDFRGHHCKDIKIFNPGEVNF